jgi:3-oxoacyl-[acyl-carrier protein] reductase
LASNGKVALVTAPPAGSAARSRTRSRSFVAREPMDGLQQEVPAGRLGTPAEVAAEATFLCSAPASYVTGQSVLVDGGLTRAW